VRAAARATGVTEGRLRTWERRYGIPRPGRSDTGRRLYDDDDLALIRRMVALTDAGLAAAEAAEAVLAESSAGIIPSEAPPAPPPPEVDPIVDLLVDAAREFDEAEVESLLARAEAQHGWPAVLDHVLLPALRETGAEWERGDLTLVHEHFISELVRRRVLGAVMDSPRNDDGPTAVLACPPTERHDLGLMGMWLALRMSGVRVVYLGQDVPRDALLVAVEQLRARAVVLSAVAGSARPDLVLVARAAATSRLGPKVFAGGSAVTAGEGAAELMAVRLPNSIEESARLVARELGLGA
jgi:MerR family transcriptional regulator, light-induced transcriptional regulator